MAFNLRGLTCVIQGIDLVAMSVNDLLVQGAEPLFFLDYFACSHLNVQTATSVVQGIAAGCKQAGCALIGGETAEMPGLYRKGQTITLYGDMYADGFAIPDDYDLAGFAVGVVERQKLLPRPDVREGDILLGLASSGVHSNGFSLVRKILQDASLDYSAPCPWDCSCSVGSALTTPTRIYVAQVLPAVRKGLIKGMSHITGGGFIGNIPRMLPEGNGASIDVSTYELPAVFAWLMRRGGVEALEMARTFNCGIGLVIAADPANVDELTTLLRKSGEAEVYQLGCVTADKGVRIQNLRV